MNYVLKNTSEVTEEEWRQYSEVFNETFEKDYTVEYFNRKYSNTCKSGSFHSFLYDDELIVGGVTAIPIQYHFGGEIRTFGSVLDLFIKKEYRKNPLILKKLYSKLEKRLKEEDVSFVYAVPNENSYTYLVKICKWKDIGELDYFALPFRPGVFVSKLKLFDFIAPVFVNLFVFFSNTFSSIFSKKEKKSPIRIERNELIHEQRYDENYEVVDLKNETSFAYRIYEEEGGRVAYLYDFHNRTSRSLNRAVRYISKKEKFDILLFIGLTNFNSLPLIKVPNRFKPERNLNFAGKILDAEKVNKDVFQLKNWEFGLLNFDAR